MTASALSGWQHYNDMGWLALRRGDYRKAEKQFRTAIEIAMPYAASHPRFLARSYHDFAFTLHEEGRYAEAEPLAKWALAVREKYETRPTTAWAQSLNTLATIYVAEKRYAEAEPLYQRAIAIWEEAAGAESPYTAGAYEDLAIVLSLQRKYDLAEPIFERAQYIFERGRPNYRALVESLTALAENDVIQGRDSDAEALYKRAVQIYDDKSIPEDDILLAHVLDRYVVFLKKAHRGAEAAPLESRALEIRAKAAPPEKKPKLPPGAPQTQPPKRPLPG
jgi:tetratricopeptide (TPR) repeat protein